MTGRRPLVRECEWDGHEYRVSRCEPDQVLDLAAARFIAEWGADDDLLDVAAQLRVAESGWWRCTPCVCGDGHSHDVWPAKPGERGAFFCWWVGWP